MTPMHPITVVGLGPGEVRHLTLEALEALARAETIHLRTDHHPLAPELRRGLGGRLRPDVVIRSFDRLYAALPTLDEVYAAVVDELLELSEREQVTYAVPGSPWVAERTVEMLRQRAEAGGVELLVIQGLSFVEPVLAAAGVVADNLQVVDAAAVAGAAEAMRPLEALFSAENPLIVCQLDNPLLASHVKLALMELYPDEHSVTLARQAGTGRAEVLPLYELDRRADIDYLTTLYVPPVPTLQNLSSWTALQHIVTRLRSPGGCPWDREQTHASLKRYLLEETYEALEAIDEGEPDRLAEELGDLLLQILLHAQMASEAGDFSLRDVVRHLAEKLIRRHPHVFGDVKVGGADEVVVNWEKLKQAERQAGTSALAGVPKALPQLAYCQAISQRAAKRGFEWPDLDGVWDKITEEFAELRAAGTEAERADELGDLLFTTVQLARWLGIDAEEALSAANDKFTRRFQALERLLGDRPMSEHSLEELDALWERAKAERK